MFFMMFIIRAGIQILAETNTAYNTAPAQEAVTNLLFANPQIDGVLSLGGALSAGAVLAMDKQGRPMVPITGENARQSSHTEQVAVEKPPRIAGSPPQPFQVPTLHPMGCAHLRSRDEIQSGTNADKRYVGQKFLAVIGKQLLLWCAKGDETEIGS